MPRNSNTNSLHTHRDKVEKLNKESKHKLPYSGRVKTICLQKNTALWIGTGGGHILLLDLSTRRPVRVIDNFCDSVRVMVTAQLGKQNHQMTSTLKSVPSLGFLSPLWHGVPGTDYHFPCSVHSFYSTAVIFSQCQTLQC